MSKSPSRSDSLRRGVAAAALIVASATVQAQVATVRDAWVRATVPGQTATGAFAQVSVKAPVTLVGASSPVAGVVELHEMALDAQNVMRMRAVKGGLPVTPAQPLQLKPGGLHVMLMDLKQPVTAGAKVPLTLVLRAADGKEQRVAVNAVARAMATPAAASAADPHAGHAGTKH